MMDIEEIKIKLQRTLRKKRYEHSLGVMAEAEKMAKLFGADTDKAIVTGLIHDCAKAMSMDEALKLLRSNGEEVDSVTLLCPPIIHAPAGVWVARSEFGITDIEILDAIRYHTVARKGMTLLDKIIYVADMIEPQRAYDGVDRLRSLAMENLDEAYSDAVKRSIIYNMQKGTVIHPATLYAWNEICGNKTNKREDNI